MISRNSNLYLVSETIQCVCLCSLLDTWTKSSLCNRMKMFFRHLDFVSFWFLTLIQLLIMILWWWMISFFSHSLLCLTINRRWCPLVGRLFFYPTTTTTSQQEEEDDENVFLVHHQYLQSCTYQNKVSGVLFSNGMATNIGK